MLVDEWPLWNYVTLRGIERSTGVRLYYDVDLDAFVRDSTERQGSRTSDTYLLVGKRSTMNLIFAALAQRMAPSVPDCIASIIRSHANADPILREARKSPPNPEAYLSQHVLDDVMAISDIDSLRSLRYVSKRYRESAVPELKKRGEMLRHDTRLVGFINAILPYFGLGSGLDADEFARNMRLRNKEVEKRKEALREWGIMDAKGAIDMGAIDRMLLEPFQHYSTVVIVMPDQEFTDWDQVRIDEYRRMEHDTLCPEPIDAVRGIRFETTYHKVTKLPTLTAFVSQPTIKKVLLAMRASSIHPDATYNRIVSNAKRSTDSTLFVTAFYGGK